MDKQLIKLIDKQFAHGKSFGTGDLQISPINFDWYRGTEYLNDLIVFSEDSFRNVDDYAGKIKVGFIIESPLIKKDIYDYISLPENYNKFHIILTFSQELIELNPDKFKFFPFGGCWIYPQDRNIYMKDKNMSIISSFKKITSGHVLRHDIIERFTPQIDGIYGGGYKFVENKLEALKNYRYSIVVEQGNHNAMFSEKLIDCFVTGTIPIYWGCEGHIGNYFNENGIIQFNTINELSEILKNCNEENYLKNLEAVKENFEISKQYVIPEDYMWNNYFKQLLNK